MDEKVSHGEKAVTEDLRLAAAEIGTAVAKLLNSWPDPDQATVPPTLFHFTDAGGLIGILTAKTVWASLATALNDASETKYAIARLLVGLQDSTFSFSNLKREQLVALASESKARVDFRSYVVSFCGADESVHWLHYGRSGTGVALEFDAQSLFAVDQFVLHRVIYATEEQDRLFAAILKCVDDLIPQVALKYPRVDPSKNPIFDGFFAELAVSLMRFAAPRIKDPAFRSENEWRLLSSEVWLPGPAENPTRETHFRAANGRIVPYKKITFEELPLRRVIIGASAPINEDEQAFGVLMDDSIGRQVPVVRSKVMVRP